MAVAIAGTGADGCKTRSEDFEDGAARGRGAAVVGDLEQVPSSAVVGDPLEQVVVVVVLEVAREQDALAADAHRQHDRGAVDGAAIGQDPVGDGVLRRPQDVDASLAQHERVPLGEAAARDIVAHGRGPQLEHPAALGVHLGLDDAADPIAR